MWERVDEGYEVTTVAPWVKVAGVLLVLATIAGIYWLGTWQQGRVSGAAWTEEPSPDTSLASRLKQKAEYAPPPASAGLDASALELARLRAELEALKAAKTVPAPRVAPVHPPPPPAIKRPAPFVLTNEVTTPTETGETYTLAAGTWLPCTLQTILLSEIEGYFTVVTRRPVYDTDTGQHLLIPQGRVIVAKDATSALILGNERIPTWALTMTLPGGHSVDLGQAPITDATGTNGLTGEVNNHVWRLLWTTLALGSLRGGQQVLHTEAGQAGPAGHVVAGIGNQGNQVAQQRLGRAQDTRPTIRVAAGELCQVLLPKAINLPVVP